MSFLEYYIDFYCIHKYYLFLMSCNIFFKIFRNYICLELAAEVTIDVALDNLEGMY